MNTIQEERAKVVKYHIDAIKFNTQRSGNFKVICNMDNQLEQYKSRIAKLSLPARFKMLKTPKTTPKVTQVELEEPNIQLDSTSQGNPDPNHKRRDIFR